MQLTILGSYGPFPAANGACSGYLIEEESYPLLLECGNGVLSRLLNYVYPWELEAVLVSHLHSDHISDLFIMRYALDLARDSGETEKSLDVYTPGEPAQELSRLQFKGAYNLHTLNVDRELSLGPYRITFLPVKHPLPTVAVKIECGGKTLVYSGDTERLPGLAEFAGKADLFLCEANFLECDLRASKPNHLSAGQAGHIASQAGVKKLLLTHLPAFREHRQYLREAQYYFPEAELAVENSVFYL